MKDNLRTSVLHELGTYTLPTGSKYTENFNENRVEGGGDNFDIKGMQLHDNFQLTTVRGLRLKAYM